MKNLLPFLVFALAFYTICGCNEIHTNYIENKPSVTKNVTGTGNENYQKLVADLPFAFDSVDYLYFPISLTREDFDLRSLTGSFVKKSGSYSAEYKNGNYINCNLDNILIRPKNKSTFRLLTNSRLKIKNLTYLYRIDTIHNKAMFLYEIADKDTNKDNEITSEDIIGLFSSKTNGDSFKRISPANEHLIDRKTNYSLGLLFFRTLEDVDKNNEFDENDRINLYEYNLLTEDTPKLIFNNSLYAKLKQE